MQVSTKLNRSHLVHGRTALILPTLGRTDRDVYNGIKQVVSVEDSMSMVHLSAAACSRRAIYVRSEVSIVCQLARRARPRPPGAVEKFAGDYDAVRDAIAAVVPGCADYNRRVRQPDGFQLPHPPRDAREFPPAPAGQLRGQSAAVGAGAAGRLVLQTLRSHDQYNTTIYGLDDRYRGVKGGRRVVFVNPADIATLGLSEGQRVDLVSSSPTGGPTARAPRQDFLVVPYSTPVGNAAAYYPRPIPGAAGSCCDQVEHPGVQGDHDPAGADRRQQERSDPGISTGGQERSDPGAGRWGG